MKKHIFSFVFLLVLGGVVYGLLLETRYSHAASSVANMLAPAKDFFANQPVLAIAAFCAAHLLAASLSLPGTCTLLNTIAGAVFGFWLACSIVYPITIVSACLVYFAGNRLRGSRLAASYRESIDVWSRMLSRQDFLLFVTLRLSPILPYALLNLVMGLVQVPFTLYLTSTAAGIFFDVTLLTNLGAGIGNATSPQSEQSLALSFFALLFVFFLLRTFIARAYDQRVGAR